MSTDLQTRRALRLIVQLWGVAVLCTVTIGVVAYLISRHPNINSPRKNVAHFLQKHGFTVQESDIVIAGGLRSTWQDDNRPVVFLGAHSFGRRLDLWVAHMRLSPTGVPLKASLQNVSSTFFHNEKKAAVSPSWVFWEAPEKPGLYHIAWLFDVRWRLHIRVQPTPEAARLTFEENVALLEGIVENRPIRVRVHPTTRRVEADGVRVDLTVSFTGP